MEDIEQALQTEVNAGQEQAQPAAEQPKVDSPAGASTPAAPPEDPELDLGTDDDKQPLKVKRSEVLAWRKGQMRQEDYTKKTQELAAQREELKEMANVVEHLKQHPQKAAKIIDILEQDEGTMEAKKEDIEDELRDLPDDDPYAKALKKQKTQMEELIKQNKSMQDKLSHYDKTIKTQAEEQATKQAQEALTTSLEENAKFFNFEDDDDKKEWRNSVLTYLVHNPQKFASEEEFLNALKDISLTQFNQLRSRNERIVGRYIKKKGPGAVPSHPGGDAGKPLSKKPTFDNLDEILEDALKTEQEANR